MITFPVDSDDVTDMGKNDLIMRTQHLEPVLILAHSLACLSLLSERSYSPWL